ncbi:hypothetical protein [Actinomadura sp. 7K507]|uniref:hypothetical protein n=1 Tax=Actinomadura sp. 7K507 TaxID=2530365 RepID=UPI001043BCAA|nr:hypothetical protein [Actinomadura sp. 7K507]TDC90059.1 hypothetical protein E1285_15490 [Actinomadura sp. 7K507]
MSDEPAQVPESPAESPAEPVEFPVELPAAKLDPAPDEPEFPAVTPPDPTGDQRVDAAVARLGELGARPVPEHVEIYEDVHQRLQELLASADSTDQDEPPGQPEQPEQGGRPAQPRPVFPDALRPRP